MKAIGKLAIQTLISENPLFQREQVFRMVGNFAFEYGLFAGHEDFKLVKDPTADIYVTYPHRSLEEFFGSFGFVQALCEGQSVHDIFGPSYSKSIFMINPLFMSFCLWFLSSNHFDLPMREKSYDQLVSYAAEQMDGKEINDQRIRFRFPAVDFQSSNKLKLKFFREAIMKCERVSTIKLQLGSISDWALDLIDLEKPSKIVFGSVEPYVDSGSTTLVIAINDEPKQAQDMLNLVLQKCRSVRRDIQIYMYLEGRHMGCDVIPMLSKYTKTLHLRCNSYTFSGYVTASSMLPVCPILTDIIFIKCQIDKHFCSALSIAVQSGKLPFLKKLELHGCSVQGQFNLPAEVKVLNIRLQ